MIVWVGVGGRGGGDGALPGGGVAEWGDGRGGVSVWDAGCERGGVFLIGLVVGFAEAHKPLSSEVQAFLIIGVLGGFTTFSAFGMDTIRLFRDHAYLAGSANVLLQVAIGLGAVVVGLRVGQALRAVW